MTQQEIDDVKFLINLLPTWATTPEKGLCPTFYGTGSYEGDLKVINRIREIEQHIRFKELELLR